MSEFRGLDTTASQTYNALPVTTSFSQSTLWATLAGAAVFALSQNAIMAFIVGLAIVMASYHSSASLEPELTSEDPA